MARLVVLTLSAGLLLGLALITAGRVPDWRSDRALWYAAYRLTPQRPRVLINLGLALAQEGWRDDALDLWARADAENRTRTGLYSRDVDNLIDLNRRLIVMTLP